MIKIQWHTHSNLEKEEAGLTVPSFKSQQGQLLALYIYSQLWLEPPTAAARVTNSSEGEGRVDW